MHCIISCEAATVRWTLIKLFIGTRSGGDTHMFHKWALCELQTEWLMSYARGLFLSSHGQTRVEFMPCLCFLAKSSHFGHKNASTFFLLFATSPPPPAPPALSNPNLAQRGNVESCLNLFGDEARLLQSTNSVHATRFVLALRVDLIFLF